MSSCDNSNIKKNYIVTGTEQDILSACTAFFTNDLYACSGDTINVNSGTLNTNTIDSTVILSGGTNLLEIFNDIDTNTFVTGFTYDGVNTLTISRNDDVSFSSNINNLTLTALTVNGILSACTGIYTTNLYGCSPITIQDNLILNSGLTFNTITNNNSLERVLVVSTGGTVEYRDVSSLITGSTTFVTGTTFNYNQAILSRNDGFDVLKISGGSNVTLSNPSTNQIVVDVTIPPDTNTFVTGFTYDDVNTFTISRNDNVDLTSTISVLSGITYYGDGSNLSGITTTDTFVTGGTFDNNTDTITFTNNSGGTFNVTGLTDTFVIAGTYTDSTDTISLLRNDGNFVNITGVTDTFTTGSTYDNGTGLATFTKNDDTTYTLDLSTIDVNDTFITGFTYDDSNTFTLNRNDGVDISTSINNVTGFTINGDLLVTGTTNISGVTTIDSTLQVDGNINITSNSFFLQGTDTLNNNISLIGVDGGDVIRIGNLGLSNFIEDDTVINGVLTADTIFLSSIPTLNNSGTDILIRNSSTGEIEYRPVSGITPDTDTFVTGGTYNESTDTITFTNNTGGTFNVTGITDNFVSGGTYNPSTLDINFVGNSIETTFDVDLTSLVSSVSGDTFVVSGNANAATSELTFTNNTGGTFTVTNSAALFSDNDINVTGGTYNPSNGCVTFTTNSGTTFDVCGFLTGITDTYVTGGTYNESTDTITFTNTSGGTFDVTGITDTFVIAGTYDESTDTISLLRNDGGFVNITGVTDTFTTGSTYDNNTALATFNRNDGNSYTLDLSTIDVNDTFSTGGTVTQNSSNNENNQTIEIVGNDGFSSYNITGVTDTFTTGGTYDNGTALITFDKNDGTTFNVDLSSLDLNDTFVTGGTLTQPTDNTNSGLINLLYSQDVLPSTYSIPYTDTFITGFTYNNNNTFTILENNGDTHNVTFSEVSGLTVNGTLDVTGDINVTGTTFYTNITGTSIGVDYIDFNNSLAPLPADLEGRIYWDEDNGTLSLGMHGGQVVQQIGLEQYYYVKNQSGATISNGRVVRAAGTLGASGRILGEYMIADGTIPPKFTLGIATEDIIDGDDGYVTEFGLVRGINTTGTPYGEVWNDGDILWVSPTVPGGLTKVEPQAPDLKIEMAIVIYADANGSLFVRPSRYPYLYDLQQVNYSAGTENNLDILFWNDSNQTWDKTNTPSFSGLTIYGNTTQIGNFNITGDTIQNGNTITNGTVDIIGSGTGCTLSVTGKTCLDGDLDVTGNVFVKGNLDYDGNLIVTGSTIISSGLTVFSGVSVDFITITTTPTENNDLIQILGRNSTTGDVEYRDVKTIGNNITTVTGTTYSATTTDDVIGVDSSTNTVTLYLPDSVSSGRLRYDIKDIGVNSFNNPITIQAAGSDTIITTSVVSSFELSADGGAVILVNTGTGQWWQM